MRILVGVCGSIAAYKACDLVRGLAKLGHEVRVVLTNGALEFVKPEIFKHLGAQVVYLPQDDHHPKDEHFIGLEHNQVLHIALVRWAQKFIIAPLSANTLNKLGAGLADDLLSCAFLASKSEQTKILFPAMNPSMWENPIVKKNVETLSQLANTLVHATGSGEMVCGENGDGKLASVDEILALTQSFTGFKSNKKILITTGATIAPLDPIRFLTNSSSGETGYVIALEALAAGHDVTVIAGQKATSKLEWLNSHPNFKLIRIKTTQDMREQVLTLFDKSDCYISSAAIGDIHFQTSAEKIKKDKLTDSLKVLNSPDILKEVVGLRKAHHLIIGFAAETELSLPILEKKWQSKPVDLLVGTKVGVSEGFGDVSPQYILYRGQGVVEFEGQLSKNQLAQKLMDIISNDQTHHLHS